MVRISSSTVHSRPQGEHGLGHELGGTGADHVHAEHLVVALVGHDLDEALGLVGHLRTAQHAERERAHCTSKPRSFASASVRPTLPISGSQ